MFSLQVHCGFCFCMCIRRFSLLFFIICFSKGGRGTCTQAASRKHTAAKLRLYSKIQICRLQIKNLPVVKFLFAVYPVRNLPSASETHVSFADGKLKICNRQVCRWPSAKFMSDKWQNKILPSAHVLPPANGLAAAVYCKAVSHSAGGEGGLGREKNPLLKQRCFSRPGKTNYRT